MEKEQLLKQIIKDLRTIKNKWVFKEYAYKGFKIQTKRFNNWFQIFRSENPNLNIRFQMDMQQKNVLKRIENALNEI